jgi:hypothetical protein
MVKEENGDLLAHSHSILNRWQNYFASYFMYMGLMMLGRPKYIELSNQYLSLAPLRLRLLLES